MKNLILITCAGAALAACASTPQHDDQLEAARAEVRQLGEEPLAHDTADRDEHHRESDDVATGPEQPARRCSELLVSAPAVDQ